VNRLRAAIERGPVIGTFVKMARPEVVDLLALAGYDFLICDLEHAQLGEADARAVLLAARHHDLPVVIRVEELTRGPINRLLEQGAVGIQLPRTRTAEDIEALADLTRFPPAGSRSVGVANLAAGYGRMPLAEYVDDADRRPVLVGQFETRGPVPPLAPLDVAFLGTVDLSVDHGAPGRLDDAGVRAGIDAVEAAARAEGVALGAFAGTAEQARRFAAEGYRYIAVSGDVSMLAAGARAVVDDVRAALFHAQHQGDAP
jgi:4-hydroxy-2-oxoheptanedioate aldolase